MASDLYQADFYLWTQDQAEALRAREGGLNGLDYDNLAEEVEDLGASERNKCRSLITRIIEHLHKLESSRANDPRNNWRGEIRTWRTDVTFVLTRSLRRTLESDLETLHAKGAALAQARFDDDEPGVMVNSDRRWTLSQILGERDDPLLQQPRLES